MFSSPSRGSIRRNRDSRAPESIKSSFSIPASTPRAARRDEYRREDSLLSAEATAEDIKGGTIRAVDRKYEKAKAPLSNGAIFSRDELHAVTAYCRLPAEALAAIENLGSYIPCRSDLDVLTGYAYLVTPEVCFAWSFANRDLESPPCYSFPIAPQIRSGSSVIARKIPFCHFIPRGTNREPGLILLRPTGELIFLENVVSSIGNDRRSKQIIPLGSGEIITCLHRCGSNVFLAATSQSRVFSISFSSSGGTLQASLTPFAQSKGLFGRFFGTTSQINIDNSTVAMASCLASDQSGAFEVYILGSAVLQKWSIVEGGTEKLLIEEDIKQILVAKLGSENSNDSIAVLDIAITDGGAAAVLFSHQALPDGLLRYRIASFDIKHSTPSFVITSFLSLECSRYPGSRLDQQARLVVPYGGPVLFVILPEVVIIRLLRGEQLEETIQMREVSTNQIIGLGAEGSDVQRPASLSNLTIVTAKSGALLIEVDTDRAEELDLQLSNSTEKVEILTRRLKSKIERAVFHSNEAQNPISFDLPLETYGNIMAAAGQLSEEIVLSKSSGLSKSVDVRLQLADRLEKLHSLAYIIAINDKMGLFSQNSIRKLSADAELVAAAIEIWQYHDTYISLTARHEGVIDLLASSINIVLSNHPDAQWEGDLLRLFFKQELNLLNDILSRLHRSIDTQEKVLMQTTSLIRVNQIFLSTFQAAQHYRAETAQLYHLDYKHISFEAWTCKLSNLLALQGQIQSTYNHLQSRDRISRQVSDEIDGNELGERSSQLETLRGQLCDLSAYTLDLFEERLQYLQIAGGFNANLEKEGRSLQDEYIRARSQIISYLVECGRSDRAFYLAEKHRDFKVLTTLCSSLEGSAQDSRIRSYLNKYGTLFAFELYEHYIREGHLSKLLDVEEQYHGLLGSFMERKEEYNRLAWIHNLNLNNWSASSERLQIEANQELNSVESKKLVLSLRKLTFVAQLNEEDVASAAGQEKIEMIDDQVDIVNVHNRIREVLQSQLEAYSDSRDLTSALDAMTETLDETGPHLKLLYCSLVSQVLDHKIVPCEDLIDLLSLADRSADSIENFKTAIEVYVRAKDIPPARTVQVLASLWRRIILFDDWLQVTDTALGAISDADIVEKIKYTALFQVLQSVSENKATSEVILAPADCLVEMSMDALQARFREENVTFVEGIHQDYKGELHRANQVITLGIERGLFDDVTRLLQESQEETPRNDDTMDGADREYISMY